MEDDKNIRRHRYEPGHPAVDKEAAHDLKNAEIQAVKESHQRPQDRDKPNEANDLKVGDKVYFFDHENHRAEGIITEILPRGDELLGTNMNTKEGRSTHGHEQLYQISSSLGTAITKLRSEVCTEPDSIQNLGSRSSTSSSSSATHTPPYILQNDQHPMSGKEAFMQERNPSHRK